MNIKQNEEMNELTQAYHNGQLSQADYRAKRREMLEHLASTSQGQDCEKGGNGRVWKRAVMGTLVMLSMLGLTVLAVKYLF